MSINFYISRYLSIFSLFDVSFSCFDNVSDDDSEEIVFVASEIFLLYFASTEPNTNTLRIPVYFIIPFFFLSWIYV